MGQKLDGQLSCQKLMQHLGGNIQCHRIGNEFVGQAGVLGGATIFTSYIPATDLCETEGSSELWALFYKTGELLIMFLFLKNHPLILQSLFPLAKA